MTRYVVLLRDDFRTCENHVNLKDRSITGLLEAYSTIEKTAVTSAEDPNEALEHVVYRGLAKAGQDKAKARIILKHLIGCERYEIYDMPEVSEGYENGRKMKRVPRDDRLEAEEVFLADQIAERRGISDTDALVQSREILKSLRKTKQTY